MPWRPQAEIDLRKRDYSDLVFLFTDGSVEFSEKNFLAHLLW